MNSNWILAILITILLICLIMIIVNIRQFSTKTTVVSSEDDPVLKATAEFRTNQINQIIKSIAAIWRINPKDLIIDSEMHGFNNSLVTVIYDDFIYRIYCFWKDGKIRMTCSYLPTNIQKCTTFNQWFKMKNGTFDYEEIESVMMDWHFKFLKALFKDENAQYEDAMKTAYNISQDQNVSDEKLTQMLIDAWNDMELDVDPKRNYNDTNNFIRVLAYILRFHDKEFGKFMETITPQQESDQEDE